jgi:hypothetical protein
LALHIGGDDNSREATLLYVVFLTIASILWSMQWFYAVYAKLLDPRLERAYLRRVSQLHLAFVASYTIALGFTLIDWRLGLCAAGLVMCLFGIRPLRPQYKPGEEPETDIQEADERPRGSAAG